MSAEPAKATTTTTTTIRRKKPLIFDSNIVTSACDCALFAITSFLVFRMFRGVVCVRVSSTVNSNEIVLSNIVSWRNKRNKKSKQKTLRKKSESYCFDRDFIALQMNLLNRRQFIWMEANVNRTGQICSTPPIVTPINETNFFQLAKVKWKRFVFCHFGLRRKK